MNVSIESIGINVNKQDVRNRGRFYIFLALMFATIFLRLAAEVNIPVLFFLVLSLYPIFFCGTDEQLSFIVCCIPFSKVFQYKYALLFCVVAFIIKSRGKIRINGIVTTVLCMLVWELLHVFYGDFSFTEYFRCFAELLVLMLISTMDLSNVNYKLILRSLAISVVGVCFIMLYLQLKQNEFNLTAIFTQSFQNYRFGGANTDAENFGLNFNSNELGFICNLAISFALLLYSRKEHSKLDIILIIFASTFGVLTLSRAAIICMALVYIGFAVAMPGNLKRKVGGFLGIIIIVGIGVFLISELTPGVYKNLVERFSEADISNGRNTLFEIYHDFIWSNPLFTLFGVGLQGYFTKVNKYTSVSNVCHNGYQEVWLVWGIVGVFLFTILFFAMVKQTKRYSDKRNLVQFAPLFLILIYILSGQFISSETALLGLIAAYICLSMSPAAKKIGENI